jgi:hypothetical protein
MIELLAAAYVIGQIQVGPNLLQTDYIDEDKNLITITEVVRDEPNQKILSDF